MIGNDKFIIRGLSKDNFSVNIRRIVSKYKLTYIEAITEVVNANQIEPEDIKTILSDDIMFQLRSEANQSNMIKTNRNKLTFE